MPEWVASILKAVADGTAITLAVAVVMDVISATAGLFTIAWLGIQIYVAITGVPFSQSTLAKRFNGKGRDA